MKENIKYEIDGLKWEKKYREPNGGDSYVIYYPTLKPFSLVYHGSKKFSYAHYGIHLGQEDRLTFLGNETQEITGNFIDCRINSKTFGKRTKINFNPSSGYTLCIPQGVGHTFDNLENIHTINDYNLYLPDKELLEKGLSEWNASGDVINIPLDITSDQLKGYYENTKEAALNYYFLVADNQASYLKEGVKEYPFTKEVNIEGKGKITAHFTKTKEETYDIPEWDEYEGIQGLGWQRHYDLKNGEHSGFIPFTSCNPYYIIDHGQEKEYTHDAYGLHLGQVDRLTFLGDPNQKVKLKLFDFRENSPTKFKMIDIEFNPTPHKYLVIPAGVGHAFTNLEKVYTINQPFLFARTKEFLKYEPGNDTIDWPLKNTNYLAFKTNEYEFSREQYYVLAIEQKKIIDEGHLVTSTPYSFLVNDDDGKVKKVLVRNPNLNKDDE